jgi:glycosyltransferase involved in cell wall biosynthesis
VAGAAVRAVEALVARRCALVGGVSEAEAELARSGLRAPRVAVVRNGIPELDGAPAAAPERPEPIAVALGRISPQRRPAATARILAGLAPAARVAWIGGASHGSDEAVRAAGVPVSGWLPHEQALERLAEATVCVHWSEWDGQSLAILEALARDVVVVASDIAANREILGPRQVCADERAATELARAALNDPALRADLLEEQRRRAAGFGAHRMAAEWLGVYERLVRPTPSLVPKIGESWT